MAFLAPEMLHHTSANTWDQLYNKTVVSTDLLECPQGALFNLIKRLLPKVASLEEDATVGGATPTNPLGSINFPLTFDSTINTSTQSKCQAEQDQDTWCICTKRHLLQVWLTSFTNFKEPDLCELVAACVIFSCMSAVFAHGNCLRTLSRASFYSPFYPF